MQQWQTVLFDLDGTLTDPGEGITNSVAHALRRMGYEVPEREALYKFIGPPLVDSFCRYYGMTPEQGVQAVACYREYFADRGLFENLVYPGIPELLAELKQQGKTVLVASSKPEFYVRKILDHFALSQYFDVIAGASMDQSKVEKSLIVAEALQRAGVQDHSTAVMVGDREFDVQGARTVGLPCIGVLFGYGSSAELTAAGALALAADVAQLRGLLLGQ